MFVEEYGTTPEGTNHCYKCCAKRDSQTMIDDGHSKRLPLYYEIRGTQKDANEVCFVKNWPGSLMFRCVAYRKGKHNWRNVERLDVWFVGPDGFIWYGVHYGYMNNIVHCRRTKRKEM
jgi:hypothetical protein